MVVVYNVLYEVSNRVIMNSHLIWLGIFKFLVLYNSKSNSDNAFSFAKTYFFWFPIKEIPL
jgi:hypothetical protein